MKFLLDECISTRLVPLLADAGHDVVHASDRDLAGHVDAEVLATSAFADCLSGSFRGLGRRRSAKELHHVAFRFVGHP